jgi:hypothetical protein
LGRIGRAAFLRGISRAMLTPVKLRIFAPALLLVVAGCASTTQGSGTVAGAVPTPSGGSSHDFPSTSAAPSTAVSSAAAPSTPADSRPATPSTHPVPANPIRTVNVHAGDGHRYTVKIWAEVKDSTCFDHAYGEQMISFLTKHPCGGLRRLLATTTVQGRPVGFAVSETGFAGTASDPYKWSAEFVRLENADGTGSVNDLLREGYRLPQGPAQVPAGEAFNVIGQDNGVTVWDAWYLDGPTPTNAKPLMELTQDLFLQI